MHDLNQMPAVITLLMRIITIMGNKTLILKKAGDIGNKRKQWTQEGGMVVAASAHS